MFTITFQYANSDKQAEVIVKTAFQLSKRIDWILGFGHTIVSIKNNA